MVRVPQRDGALEAEEGEAVDDGEAGGLGAGALEGVEGELEGGGEVLGGRVLVGGADGGVEGGEGGGCGPVLVDGLGEDGASYEGCGGGGGGEGDEAEGGLGAFMLAVLVGGW